MQFNFKAYSELYPREEPPKPIIETPIETFKPKPTDVEPITRNTEVEESSIEEIEILEEKGGEE